MRSPISSLSLFQVQHTWCLVHGTCKNQTDYRIRGKGGCFAHVNSLRAGTTTLHVLQAEQLLHHATEEKAKRSFLMERESIAKHNCQESAVHAEVAEAPLP